MIFNREDALAVLGSPLMMMMMSQDFLIQNPPYILHNSNSELDSLISTRQELCREDGQTPPENSFGQSEMVMVQNWRSFLI